MKITGFLITTLFLVIFTASITVVNAQGLTPEDVASMESVSAVAMSPDGERVAYTLGAPRSEEDDIGRNFSELYIISSEGGDGDLMDVCIL